MQVIIPVNLTVEEYMAQAYHTRIRPPDCHELFGCSGTLKPHGAYSRCTTNSDGKTVVFFVARFLEPERGVTISCLPSFAQPYRVVANPTIQSFVEGHHERSDVQRNEGLLKRYSRRFEGWYQTLRGRVGNGFGRGPPKESATAFWRRTVAVCGSLADLTVRLVREFRTTCFGTYRCHQPARAL